MSENKEKKQVSLHLDPAASYGAARLEVTYGVPRRTKVDTEIFIAKHFLSKLHENEGLNWNNLRPNPNANDHPDVYFKHEDCSEVGIELTEIMPEQRFAKDALLNTLRTLILEVLRKEKGKSDIVVNISLPDDYSPKLKIGKVRKLAPILAGIINKITTSQSLPISVWAKDLPCEIQEYIRWVSLDKSDLRNDPRIKQEGDPLIIFAAQNTLIIPDKDYPNIVSTVLEHKCNLSIHGACWLLVWSESKVFLDQTDILSKYMLEYLNQKDHPYSRCYYFYSTPIKEEVRKICNI